MRAEQDFGANYSDETISVLFKEHRLGLVRMCTRQVGDSAVAEEIVQETFARALVKGLDDSRSPWPWLTTVARNLCIDHLRREGRNQLMDLDALPEVDETQVESPLDYVRLLEAREAITQALTTLSPRERRVIWMRDAEGRKYDEIALLESCSRTAARNVAWRARQRLKALLADVRTWGFAFFIAARAKLRKVPLDAGYVGANMALATASVAIAVSALSLSPTGSIPDTNLLIVLVQQEGLASSLNPFDPVGDNSPLPGKEPKPRYYYGETKTISTGDVSAPLLGIDQLEGVTVEATEEKLHEDSLIGGQDIQFSNPGGGGHVGIPCPSASQC